MKNLKIWHISDTHGMHKQLKEPDDYDIIIHSGDAANYRDPYLNDPEMRDFINWFAARPCMIRIYVAGNHDTSVEKGLYKKEYFENLHIHYLYNEGFEVFSINFWGSPLTPDFGNWSFMRNRTKINNVWKEIPEDTDILITHGPPKRILDLSKDRAGDLEFCGDSALDKNIKRIKPKLHCFGHIHNGHDIQNSGVFIANDIVYSNASCVTDGKFREGLSSHGNLFEIDLDTKKIIPL